jgi:nucleoside-diphosphate-sugar epimerase
MVFVSSATVCRFGRYVATESSRAPRRHIPYVTCKERAETLIRSCDAIEYVVIRPGNVFGPRDNLFFSPVCRALEKGYMGYISGGRALTCPSYVENLADAIVLAGTVLRAAGKTYAITDGMRVTWREFIEAVAAQLGTRSPSISIPRIIAEPASVLMTTVYSALGIRAAPLLTRYRVLNASTDYCFDILPARQELGYSPRVDFRESIRRSVEWYLSEKERGKR